MIAFKKLDVEDINCFWNFLNVLDIETNYMMYEPNERKQRTNIHELKADIQSNVVEGNDFLQIAMEDLDKWAKENGILRLELTVECHNEAARHLYEKSGFEIEGIRRKSMHVGKEFVDEYYMAKIL